MRTYTAELLRTIEKQGKLIDRLQAKLSHLQKHLENNLSSYADKIKSE